MKKYFFQLAFLCFLIVVFNSCKPSLNVPKPSTGTANFQKTIAVGGSYMAGYQDGALYASGQTNSLPAILATQFKLVGGGNFVQPMMPDNNGLGLNIKSWQGPFISKNTLGYVADCKGVTALQPIINNLSASAANPYLNSVQGTNFNNYGIPGATTADLLNLNLSLPFSTFNPNPFYTRFATSIGASTVAADAAAQHPTFFIAWLGMENIYNYAQNGGYKKTILSPAAFGEELDSIIGTLALGNTKGVIATIPDFRDMPFFTTIPSQGVVLTQHLADSLNTSTGNLFHFQADSNGFVIEYPANSGKYRKLSRAEYVLLDAPLDSMKCNMLGVLNPLPNRYVLDSSEIQIIENAITSYNQVIQTKALQYNLALVDMNAYFKTVKNGILDNGVSFNSALVTGGFFSLDGFCPCQKGYALIANQFITAINQKYGAAIPPTNVNSYQGISFP
ncbi:MAG: hypothetical protein ABI199_02140 [Bacteroidia bacterium]